jgi:multisubunit Na+/H+ antiporter MnhB subunit
MRFRGSRLAPQAGLAGLVTIGVAFIVNAFVTGYATGGTASYAIRIPVLAGLLVLNCGLYFATFTLPHGCDEPSRRATNARASRT